MHLKRLVASKHFPIRKKERKFTTCPMPGPHAKNKSIPLRILVRDILKIADKEKEAKKILNNREILIDGTPEREPRYPVGLMDTITIPKTKKYYRIIPVKGKLTTVEIPEEKASLKLCRITGKTTIKKGLTQLNLHDSRNIIIKDKKESDNFKVGDTIIITVPGQEIKKHIKLEKGNIGLITAGKHEGVYGKIKEIKNIQGLQKNKVTIETGETDTETLKDYIFVIGKDKPEIIIP